jgi:hypothetical protein
MLIRCYLMFCNKNDITCIKQPIVNQIILVATEQILSEIKQTKTLQKHTMLYFTYEHLLKSKCAKMIQFIK